MENKDFIEYLQSAKAVCPGCKSKNLLLFVETRIKDVLAYACFDCYKFEVCAKNKEDIKEYFKNRNANFDRTYKIPR